MDIEIIIVVLMFIITVAGLVAKFSSLQQKQNDSIQANSKLGTKNANAILDLGVAIADLEKAAQQYTIHETNIEKNASGIIELEGKIKTQTSYNIKAEKDIGELKTSFSFFNVTLSEMKEDIRYLVHEKNKGED